jgi:hypothetical protein
MVKKVGLIFLIISIFVIGIDLINDKNLSEKKYSDQSPAGELSNEEYLKIEKEMLSIVENEDPRVAMTAMRDRVDSNPSLAKSCHSIVHDIGHASYVKYKDFGLAMQYQDEFCNSGYLHGIIEIHFAKSKDIFTDIQNVCAPYKEGSFLSLECFHGIGHGLMYYTLNDLPKSLKICEQLNNKLAQNSCAGGVFMENFNTDQKDHLSTYLKIEDPSYPCTIQDKKLKSICYTYAPIYFLNLHKNDYKGALDWCRGVEQGYHDACAEGVGGQIIKENIQDPIFVEKICISGKINETTPCIRGMINLYTNHFGDLEKSKKLCFKLQFMNRQNCLETLDLRPPFE